MKFARSAPSILIGAVIVVVAAITFISNRISHQMAASFEEGTFTTMSRIARATLKETENRAIASAEIIAAMPEVKRAFAARDKQGLQAIVEAAFKLQEDKYGISQAQFHLAPATSFLRVHNPSRPAEDLSKYRQIVVEVNRSGSIRKGIEVTTSGIGIFGTLPMTDEKGERTGSFEMAMEFGPMLDDMKKLYNFELGLYIDETILRETATSLKPEVYSDQNRVGKFIKFHATHNELMRSLVTSDVINVAEEDTYLREAGGAPWGVLMQPVYNYAGKQIGVLAIARDFSDTRSADGQAKVWQAALGLGSIILLIGFILAVIKGALLRPLDVLNAKFEALAEGGDAGEADTNAGPAEMRRLAASYEALRAKSGKPEGEA
jgi:hypothetical protein